MAKGTKRKPIKGIDAKKFAEVAIATKKIGLAMEAAGYAKSTAKRGWKNVSPECLLEYERLRKQRAEVIRKVGSSLTAEEQEDLVRGRLMINVVEGKDAGVQSARLLGQDRRVNLFVPEHTTGVFVLEMPAHLLRKVNATVISAEHADKQLEAQNATSPFFSSGRPEDRGTGKTTFQLAEENHTRAGRLE